MRIGKRTIEDLSKRWSAAVDPDGAASRDTVWDDELKGFGVRRQRAARTASFVLKYRVKGDKQQRFVTLGEWPSVNPDAAREEARRIKEAAALGRDLLAERRAEAERQAKEAEEGRRRSIPLTEILDAWRAATEASIAKRLEAGRSVAHEREMLRLEAKTLRPFVSAETVGTFDPDRLEVMLDRATGRSAALNLRTLVSRVAKFARSWLLERGIKANWQRSYELRHDTPLPRDHRYDLAEAAKLWIAAGGLGRRGALVRFMLLTACRRSEAQRLKHEHLVLSDPISGPYFEMPARMVKHKRLLKVPLPSPAVAMLLWLPRRQSKKAGTAELVFAGRGNRPVGGWTDIRRALLEEAGVGEGTLHDIRRTVVSTLADHGWEPSVVDKLLNHAASATMSGVMGVYQHSEQWKQKRTALTAWAELLMEEVERQQKWPLSRQTWGFDAPFADARIVRASRKGRGRRKPTMRRRSNLPESDSPALARS